MNATKLTHLVIATVMIVNCYKGLFSDSGFITGFQSIVWGVWKLVSKRARHCGISKKSMVYIYYSYLQTVNMHGHYGEQTKIWNALLKSADQ